MTLRRHRALTRATTRRLDGATGGGVVTRTVLPGGLRVVTEAMSGGRSASVGIWVAVGSRDEAVSLAGTSHFLEHLLFKGTKRRSALDIASAMDAVGGEFNAFTEKEHTCYYATVLDRDLPLAIDIVSDVVLNATVDPRDVDIERGVVLEEIAMRDDDPADLVHDEFATSLFGSAPLGRPILGTEDSIRQLTRRQVDGYYRRRYTPDAMVFAVAGNVEHRDVVRSVRRAFADRLDTDRTPAAPRAGAHPKEDRPAQQVTVVKDDIEQANLILGMHGLSRQDPRRWALGVLSAALGGGMSSRLFQNIREKYGLVYAVFSGLSAYRDAGILSVYAGTAPANARKVVNLIIQEFCNLKQKSIPAEELQRAKDYLKGNLLMGLESTTSRMANLARQELYYGGCITLDEVAARIDAVTRENIIEVARDLFQSGRIAITVLGPRQDFMISRDQIEC
jgi:predicted Zn-dependent peptidase